MINNLVCAVAVAAVSTAAAGAAEPDAPASGAAEPALGDTKPLSRDEALAVRAILAQRRARHLGVLADYRDAGVFPVNDSVPGVGHFLMDVRGTFCAVAHIIANDGHRALIEEKSKTENDLLFAEVDSGPFADWIATSGFTAGEIALIQRPMPFVGRRPGAQQERRITEVRDDTRDKLSRIDRQLRERERLALDRATERLEQSPAAARELIRQSGRPAAPPPGVRFAAPPPSRN